MSKKIVCMIRGDESGRAVQDCVIDLVKGISGELTFLHVIDVSILSLENKQLEAPAREELTWLGRVIINLATERAQTAGVRARVPRGPRRSRHPGRRSVTGKGSGPRFAGATGRIGHGRVPMVGHGISQPVVLQLIARLERLSKG